MLHFSSKIQFKKLNDKRQLQGLLARNPQKTSYLLGDLEEPFFSDCTWYGSFYDGQLLAVLLLYKGLSVPTLLTYGDPDLFAGILDHYHEALPSEGFAKVHPEHLHAFTKYFEHSVHGNMWCMTLDQQHYLPSQFTTQTEKLRRITNDDILEEILKLFEINYPDNYFEATQLKKGVYFGLFVDDKLISIAGTHVFSQSEKVASLGNIVTAKEYRGRGYANAVLSALVEQLFTMNCKFISLHVDQNNHTAINSYRRAGFAYHSDVIDLHYSKKT